MRESKFRTSRLVPLHPTATVALTVYAADRDTRNGALRSGGFFRADRAPALMPEAVRKPFPGSVSVWDGPAVHADISTTTICAMPSRCVVC